MFASETTRMTRSMLAAVVAAAAVLALPAGAGAANFCVGASSACTGSPVAAFDADVSGIAGAVSAANANAGADNIFIAAGTYVLDAPFAPVFAASQDVHIIGAGTGQTTFLSSEASAAQMTFDFKTAASDASGFSLIVSGTPSDATGVQVFTGEVTDFVISQPDGFAGDFHALDLDSGATARVGTIEISSPNGVGLQFDDEPLGADNGLGHATDLTMLGAGSASIGVALDVDDIDLHKLDRLSISGFSRGVEITSGNFQLMNTLIDMRALASAQGLDAYNGISNSNIFPDVRRLTVVGSGEFQTALAIGAGASGSQAFSGGFVDVVLFAAGANSTGLICQGGASVLSATINTYAIRGTETNQGGCSPSKSNKLDLTGVDPGFRDFDGADYRPRPGSPLIDGGPVGDVIGPSEKDLAGGQRLVDGNGDGTALADIGAYEYQRVAPTAEARAPLSSPRAGASATFSATGFDADGDSLAFSWSFDDGSTAAGPSVDHAFAAPGTHVATVTVTDETGLTASASTTVAVRPLPTARITAKPKTSFAQRGKGFAVAKKKQPFFTVVFTETSTAKLTMQSIGRNKKLKKVKGSQTLVVKNAANKLGFGGKFGGKRLKAGKYRVTITPQAADGSVGKPVTVNFTLK